MRPGSHGKAFHPYALSMEFGLVFLSTRTCVVTVSFGITCHLSFLFVSLTICFLFLSKMNESSFATKSQFGAVHYLFTLIRALLLVAAERPKVELVRNNKEGCE